MFARLMKQRQHLLAMAVMLPLAIACSDSDPTSPEANAIAGRWQVTSFQVLGMELMEEGMSIALTFASTETYTIDIHDETLTFCQPTNCHFTGTYSATATQITMEPDSEEMITYGYSIQGDIMTFTGESDGVSTTMRLQRS